MGTLWNDIKYAFRQLGKSWGFTITAVMTLAIGIGANIIMFSVVNTVLLRPLPFQNPERLVVIQQHFKQIGVTSGFSYPDFLDFKEQNQVFEDFAAYSPTRFDLYDGQSVSKIDSAMVSSNFFSLLKTSAYIGRTFTGTDEGQNSERTAVISYDFWADKFGRDKNVLGRTITLQDIVYTIVGVLPRGFSYPNMLDNSQVWTVLNPVEDQLTNRSMNWLGTVGRLKPGLTTEQALNLLNELQNFLVEEKQSFDSDILIYGLHDLVVRNIRTILWILYVIVGFILLIVCANVANLYLSRAASRYKEIAVRSALGANKLRLLRQFITESIVLSLIAGIAGLILSVWLVAFFRVKIANFVPMADSIGIDPQVLLFSLGLSLLVGVLLGIAPFFLLHRSQLGNTLTERRAISGYQAKLSNILVSGQIAAAMVLTVGMVLMIRSMMRLSSADIGFNRKNLVTFTIAVDEKDSAQRYQLASEFADRLGAFPQVKAVSTDSSMPSSQRVSYGPVNVEGYTTADGKQIMAVYHSISPDYFRTLQIPILKGRDISSDEHEKKERVVLVSQSLAHLFWPDSDPIEMMLTFGGQQYRVIGVVDDMVQGNIMTDKPNHLFFPFDGFMPGAELKFVIRTESKPDLIIQQARTILHDMDSTLPLYDVTTFKVQMDTSISQELFTTAFLVVFASIALVLIMVGIYGVVSYTVVKRTSEIGIRIALGAQQKGILFMILKQGIVLLTIGSIIGFAFAIGLTRFLSAYLYEISTTDPVSFILVLLLITVVSMLGCFIPALRATKIDPMEALRHE